MTSPPVREITQVKDTTDELDAFKRLRTALPADPRELKRLGNVHKLVKILTQRPESPPSTADQRLLVAWIVFCLGHPDCAEGLLHEARSAEPEAVLRVVELDAMLAELNRGLVSADPSVLTATKLKDGAQLAEAVILSRLIRDDGTEPAPDGLPSSPARAAAEVTRS